MINPMLQVLGRNQPLPNNLNQVKNMLNMVRSSGNPQAMLNNMLAQNPQMQNVINYINQNGGNPQQAFYKMAQERGVNPDDILNMLK